MAKMQTVFYTETHECQFFFKKDGTLLRYWYVNDSDYREEYMLPLFKDLGINIEWIEPTDNLVKDVVNSTLLNEGFAPNEDECN